MAAKDRRTKAQLLEALSQADRATDARIKAILEDMQSLRDDRTRIAGELHNAKTALAELEAQNNQFREQVVTMETENQRQRRVAYDESRMGEIHMEGRLTGQKEAFLSMVNLLLDRIGSELI